MAADTQGTLNGNRVVAPKLERFETNECVALIGIAGDAAAAARVRAELKRHIKKRVDLSEFVPGDPAMWDEGCCLIAIRPKATPVGSLPVTVWKTCKWGVHRFHGKDEQAQSMGSGMDFALGAMAVGADAFHAVQIAATFDAGTGGPVEFICFES